MFVFDGVEGVECDGLGVEFFVGVEDGFGVEEGVDVVGVVDVGGEGYFDFLFCGGDIGFEGLGKK